MEMSPSPALHLLTIISHKRGEKNPFMFFLRGRGLLRSNSVPLLIIVNICTCKFEARHLSEHKAQALTL